MHVLIIEHSEEKEQRKEYMEVMHKLNEKMDGLAVLCCTTSGDVSTCEARVAKRVNNKYLDILLFTEQLDHKVTGLVKGFDHFDKVTANQDDKSSKKNKFSKIRRRCSMDKTDNTK